MKKLVKRFVSVLLVLCVLAGVSVTASAAGVSDFSDVKKGRWSYDAVCNARAKGYVNGIGNNKFDPYGQLTIAQLSQVIYNMAGRPRYLYGYNDGHSYVSGYFTHPSVGGEVRTLADYERWSAWFKSIYPADGYGYPTKTFYIDLQATDCVKRCKEESLNWIVNTKSDETSYDYLSYNSGGKWFTSAYVWAHQMRFIPLGKTAYDKATRGDIVNALYGLYRRTSDWFSDGEWKFDSRYTKWLSEEPDWTPYGGSMSHRKVEDDKVYTFEWKTYDYLWDSYEVPPEMCYGRHENGQWFFPDGVGWAIENNVIAGNGTYSRRGKKNLNLTDNVTREEFAQFLYNYDKNIG